MTRRSVAGGFTLIEVLVALVIVAVGVAALLSALNSAANSTAWLRDKAFAQWIAANRIAETRLATNPPTTGKSEGAIDYAGQRWQWRQDITATQFPSLRRIDVRVRPERAAHSTGPAAAPSGTDEDTGDWTIELSGSIGSSVAFATGADPIWEPAPTGTGSGGSNPPPGTPSPAPAPGPST
jgi:general secretion pathway protein I